MELKLRITDGKKAGQLISVPNGKFYIGRAEDCQLRPHSDLISRHHCVLTVEGDRVAVRDFGSKNGTFINNERVRGEQMLAAGDLLRVGHLEFEIVFSTSVGGAKKAPIKDVKEAVERVATVRGSNEKTLDEWFSDDDEPAEVSSGADSTETQTIHANETFVETETRPLVEQASGEPEASTPPESSEKVEASSQVDGPAVASEVEAPADPSPPISPAAEAPSQAPPNGNQQPAYPAGDMPTPPGAMPGPAGQQMPLPYPPPQGAPPPGGYPPQYQPYYYGYPGPGQPWPQQGYPPQQAYPPQQQPPPQAGPPPSGPPQAGQPQPGQPQPGQWYPGYPPPYWNQQGPQPGMPGGYPAQPGPGMPPAGANESGDAAAAPDPAAPNVANDSAPTDEDAPAAKRSLLGKVLDQLEVDDAVTEQNVTDAEELKKSATEKVADQGPDPSKPAYYTPDASQESDKKIDEKKKGKLDAGKLPKAMSTDSREAAADTLKRLFGRR